MRKKCIVISTIIVLLFEILFPGLITYAEDGSSSSGNGIKISKSVNWYGTNNPDNYKATYRLFEYTEDLTIESIEDLIDLSIDVSKGNPYRGKNIVLNKDLDFENDSSYEDSKTKEYGDVNKDGNVQTLKEELTNKKSGMGFPPIGKNRNNPFLGSFYGKNHEIKNLYINQTDESEEMVGLFGYTISAKIYDLTVEGTINSNKGNAQCYIGGIIGYASNGNLYNCCNKVNINVKDVSYGLIGGIIGFAYSAKRSDMTNCINTGKISCVQENLDKSSEYRLGGITGETNWSLQSCCNSGEIYTNLKEVTNSYLVGGIEGCGYEGYIDKCYNTANINVSNEKNNNKLHVGGISGESISAYSRLMKNSYNSGNISIKGTNRYDAGGIVGYFPGVSKKEIINCLNTGNISCNQANTGRNIYGRRDNR